MSFIYFNEARSMIEENLCENGSCSQPNPRDQEIPHPY